MIRVSLIMGVTYKADIVPFKMLFVLYVSSCFFVCMYVWGRRYVIEQRPE